MAYLAVKNIITRRVIPNDPQHALIKHALLALDHQHEVELITTQILIEFQALATRPIAANGLGMTSAQASAGAQGIEAQYELIPDSPAIYHFDETWSIPTMPLVGKYMMHAW